MTGIREEELCLLATNDWTVESDCIRLLRLALVLARSPSDVNDGRTRLIE